MEKSFREYLVKEKETSQTNKQKEEKKITVKKIK